MKAEIIKKEYFVAKTKDGHEYFVDITDPIIKKAYEEKSLIDGIIIEDEVQDVYDDGTYARSYSVYEKFIPKK